MSFKQWGYATPTSALKEKHPFPVKLVNTLQILVWFHRKGPLINDTQGLQFEIPFLVFVTDQTAGAPHVPLQDHENGIWTAATREVHFSIELPKTYIRLCF